MNIIKGKFEDWYTSKMVTEVTTYIGNTGYGKTYATGKIQEKYLENQDNGWCFGTFDGMGIHFVQRAYYDNLVIIGGRFGDYELDEMDEIIPVLYDHGYSFVLDSSKITQDESKQVAAGFFEYAFDWHEVNRKPRNYIIEESDVYLGQVGANRVTRDNIILCITKGRMNGMGFSLISQRYTMIHKTPLAQTKNYVVFNTMSPNDTKVLKELMGTDVSDITRVLKVGQCLIMNRKGHQVYKVGKKNSPDEAATPEVGVELEDVEVKPLNAEMKAIIDEERC